MQGDDGVDRSRASLTLPPPVRDPRRPLSLGDRNQNPSGVGFVQLLREDFRTHGRKLSSGGFWALAIHRFGNWRMDRARALRAPMTLLYRIARHGATALWKMDLPYNSRIGRRVRFDHHGCVFLGALSVGDDVVFRHAVTVGLASRHGVAAPIIGDRVEVGPGACIVGGIQVGDDAFVGANTVLTENLPARATALGNPARIVDLDKVVAPVATAADAKA